MEGALSRLAHSISLLWCGSETAPPREHGVVNGLLRDAERRRAGTPGPQSSTPPGASSPTQPARPSADLRASGHRGGLSGRRPARKPWSEGQGCKCRTLLSRITDPEGPILQLKGQRGRAASCQGPDWPDKSSSLRELDILFESPSLSARDTFQAPRG